MTAKEKSVDRLRTYKESIDKTYEELAEMLDYSNSTYISAFVSGQRTLSKEAAKRLQKLTGWRSEYWRGIDDYKTDEDYINRETPLAKEEIYIESWNAILHEIAEYGNYDLSFIQKKPDYEVMCQFSGVSIPFDDFRNDMLAYAKLYIDRHAEKEKKRKQSPKLI